MRWLVGRSSPRQAVWYLTHSPAAASTGIGAVLEDRMFLGLEREAAYVDIACARLTHWAATAAQEEVLP